MDPVKESFVRVRNDIQTLQQEITSLTTILADLHKEVFELTHVMHLMNQRLEEETANRLKQQTLSPVSSFLQKSLSTDIPAQKEVFPAEIGGYPTQNTAFKPQNDQILSISSGNRGVPADRQTDQQTTNTRDFGPKDVSETFQNARQLLESLESVRKDLALSVKTLTEQEFLVFSTIYQLELEQGFVDYRMLSEHLHLTESSIRDYIGRLFKKNLPLEKRKINNKTIHIGIEPNFKKVVTLPTLTQLRGK